MIERIEDAKEVVIGRYYNVPCVKWSPVLPLNGAHRPWWLGATPVIIGGLHDDREIIGFTDDHWHFDWRFCPAYIWKQIVRWSDPNWSAAAKVISIQNTSGVVFRAHRKCLRGHILFPGRSTEHRSPFLSKLEAAYAGTKLNCGHCPHRGIKMTGAPLENGLLVCPGHGLSFHPETGLMTPRT